MKDASKESVRGRSEPSSWYSVEEHVYSLEGWKLPGQSETQAGDGEPAGHHGGQSGQEEHQEEGT